MNSCPLPIRQVDLEPLLAKPIAQAIDDWGSLSYQPRRETLRGILDHQDTRVLPMLLQIMQQPERQFEVDVIDCCKLMPTEFLLVDLRRTAIEGDGADRSAARKILDHLELSVLSPPPDGARREEVTAWRLTALRDEDAWIRKSAARDLISWGWEDVEEVFNVLFEMSQHDPDWRTRQMATGVWNTLFERRIQQRMPRRGVQRSPLGPLVDDVLALVSRGGCWYSVPSGGRNSGRRHLEDLAKSVGAEIVPHLLRKLAILQGPLAINAILEELHEFKQSSDTSWIAPLIEALSRPPPAHGLKVDYRAAGDLLEPRGADAIAGLTAQLQGHPELYEVGKQLVLLRRVEGLDVVLARFPAFEGPPGPAPAEASDTHWAIEFGIHTSSCDGMPRGDPDAPQIAMIIVDLLKSNPAAITSAQLVQLSRLIDVYREGGGDCIMRVGVNFAAVRHLALREYHRRLGRLFAAASRSA